MHKVLCIIRRSVRLHSRRTLYVYTVVERYIYIYIYTYGGREVRYGIVLRSNRNLALFSPEFNRHLPSLQIYVLRIAEHLAAGFRKGASRGHEARILLRRLDIPGHVDFYVRDS
jgi:hypothetical protein